VPASYLLLITVVGAVEEGAGFIITQYQTKDTGGKRMT
jgi:hypothetical protein